MIDPVMWDEIKTRLLWLSFHKNDRDLEMNKTDGKAAKYAQYQIKTLGRMRSYPDQEELADLLSSFEFDLELKEVMLPAVRLES